MHLKVSSLFAVGLAMCLSGSVVSGFDFHSDEAARCAGKHWDEIRALVNPKLSMMSGVLPPEGAKKVKDLLNGSNELPVRPPPRDWLGKAADAVPEGLMSLFGKDIIEKCVNDMKGRK
ncbi:hypothetical protein IWW38_004095 [Coemansia aciculifera]|uniref:Uncharacterized protein n=1 Tax=Coemansia aciculifera TaxID=417176 RepID=A0ACC1LZN0_9FUNG|nr:hypothetical protein IWW38_004095 [Coemansia aciculifera]